MAAALFQERIAQAGMEQTWTVASAGTWTTDGQPAASSAQQAMAARGLDISQHRSREVTREMLRASDLILVMERGHKEALGVEFPEVAQRVLLLSEVVDGSLEDIHDPIGGRLEEFEAAAAEIDERLGRGFQNILRTGQENGVSEKSD
jgi:protein-tyrosine-phosphatase